MQAVIDRPKGFEKVFPTPDGPVTRKYPVDYGYLLGLKNPEDGEEPDVFFGSGGPLFGRFMKGQNLDGTWKPDETKWYHGCTAEELAAVKELFTSQSPGLLQDFVAFPGLREFLQDIRFSCVHY